MWFDKKMRILLGMMLAWTLSGAAVDGIELHWTSAGKGKTVILVHGWTGDESIWSAQTPALVAAKYRVITLDLPGHGKSGSPKDGKFSMDLFARAIEAVRTEAKVNRAVLVGHSMGTPVVRQYARLYPKRTAALVLVDGLVAKASSAAVYAGLGPRFSGPEGPKNHEDFVRAMCKFTTDDMRAGILRVSMATPAATVSGAMAALGDPAIWKDDVIDVPVLGIYADKSQLGDKETMHRVFPKLEYVEIPATDHFLMMEKPEEFNRILIGFLRKR
jgi:pimeloyl-ACP methyl ester carboxylesterase